ncbi:hypothetical protein V8E36_007017 [Tilletia maclaganii]
MPERTSPTSATIHARSCPEQLGRHASTSSSPSSHAQPRQLRCIFLVLATPASTIYSLNTAATPATVYLGSHSFPHHPSPPRPRQPRRFPLSLRRSNASSSQDPHPLIAPPPLRPPRPLLSPPLLPPSHLYQFPSPSRAPPQPATLLLLHALRLHSAAGTGADGGHAIRIDFSPSPDARHRRRRRHPRRSRSRPLRSPITLHLSPDIYDLLTYLQQ